MVQGRAVGTYQCTGADGRHVCCASLCKRQARGPYPSQDGQHISPVVCDQDGRHTVSQTNRGCTPNVGLVPPKADNPHTSQGWKTRWPTRSPGKYERQQSGSCTRRCSTGSVLTWGRACTVDIFAMRLNHQLDKYVSWRPDPGAMMTNAFHIRWTDMPNVCKEGEQNRA